MYSAERRRIYLLAAAASLLLSLFAVWQNDLINHDGVLYLRAVEGDAGSIRWIGNWLFYSKLIGGLARLTGLDTENSAYLLNALLDLLLVLAFLRFVEELGGRREQTLAWAAILVLALPYLNGNRAEIIRDHGYWAFTLVAMIHYLRLVRNFSWKALLLWNLFMAIATLFRVEGAVFLALMPLGMLLRSVPLRQRIGETALACLPVAATLALLWAWMAQDGDTGNRLTKLLANSGQLLEIFTTGIPRKAEQLRDEVLPDLSRGTATLVLYFAVLLSVAKDLAESLSWPLAFIILFRRWFPAPGLPGDYGRLLLPYAAISLLVLFVQGSRHFIMVSRYTMALALLLLPVAVFSLDEFWRRYRHGQAPAWLTALVLASLLWLAGDSLVNASDRKPYITDAARWAAAHLPPGSRVVTDYETLRLDYYAEKAGARTLRFERFTPGETRLGHFGYAFVRRPAGRLAERLRGKAEPIWRSGGGGRDVTVYALTGPHAARRGARRKVENGRYQE